MSRLRLGSALAPSHTSFDDCFCGYQHETSFCYSGASSSYRVVTFPVHTCPFPAAFDIESGNGTPARPFDDGSGSLASNASDKSSTSTAYVDDVTVRLP